MKMNMKIGAVTLACAITIGSTPLSAMAAEVPQKKEPLKIGVMSDTHYFSKSLYGDCEDFTTAITTSTILTEKVFLPKRHRTQTEQL